MSIERTVRHLYELVPASEDGEGDRYCTRDTAGQEVKVRVHWLSGKWSASNKELSVSTFPRFLLESGSV